MIKLLHLKNNLLVICLLSLFFTSLGCEEILNLNSGKLVIYVGLTNEPLKDSDEIEIVAGTSNGFTIIAYQEDGENIAARSIDWKVVLRDDPSKALDPNIKTEVKSQHFEIDARDLTITEPIYLSLTAKKGINNAVSKTIKLTPAN